MRRTIRTIRQETPSRRESDEVRQGIECSRPTKAVVRSNGSHAVAPVKEAWEETAVPLALRSGAVPVPSSAPGSRADA